MDAKTVKFELSITPEMNAKILEWRRQQPDVPSRNEAIRRLLRIALDTGSQARLIEGSTP